jgi:hypothetical protein
MNTRRRPPAHLHSTLETILRKLEGIEALLQKQAAEAARVIPERPMSVGEVAAIVGKSRRVVERWIARGLLRARRITGHSTFITPANLRAFLDPGQLRPGSLRL